jgi:hypothetical protein
MGNYASTENTNEAIESGVDTRPIDKETQKKIAEELEKILFTSLGSAVTSKPKEKLTIDQPEEEVIESEDDESEDVESEDFESEDDESEDDESEDDESEDDESEDDESEDSQFQRVKIDQTAMLRALIEVEQHNAELDLAECRDELENTKKAHEVEVVVLKSVITQRENDITRRENEINELKNKIEELEKNVQKWRNFYFEASFTNTECQKCKNSTFTLGQTRPEQTIARPGLRRRRLRSKTRFGQNNNENTENLFSKQIFNINTNGRQFETQISNQNFNQNTNQIDWNQNNWGNQNNWTWNTNTFGDENNKIDWGKFTFPKNI